MQPGGRLIFTGSVLGERPREGLTAYSASKAGLVGLAKGLALDLASSGITVNVVAPGWFDSPLAEAWKNNPELEMSVLTHTAQKRWGVATDLAGAYQFLASDAVGLRHRHRHHRRRRILAGMSRRVVVITGAGGALGSALSLSVRDRTRHRPGAE